MKQCPVCQATSFDDALTCYSCMHRFDDDLDAEAVQAPEEPSARLDPEEPPARLEIPFVGPAEESEGGQASVEPSVGRQAAAPARTFVFGMSGSAATQVLPAAVPPLPESAPEQGEAEALRALTEQVVSADEMRVAGTPAVVHADPPRRLSGRATLRQRSHAIPYAQKREAYGQGWPQYRIGSELFQPDGLRYELVLSLQPVC